MAMPKKKSLADVESNTTADTDQMPAGVTVEDASIPPEKVKTANPSAAPPVFTVEDGTIVSARTVHDDMPHGTGLQRLSVREGESVIVRFITSKFVTLGMHFGVPDDGGGKRALGCNGTGCVLCHAKLQVARNSLLPVFSADDESIKVLSFGRSSAAGSLCFQVLTALKAPDYTETVFELTKPRFYVLRRLAKIGDEGTDGRDFGDDALRDIVETGQIPTPEDLVATVERMDNDEILQTFEKVARRLRQYGSVTKK
jgi:hypothetical protein